ncbi:T cell receptor beta variable 16 [Vulpes lagopus]
MCPVFICSLVLWLLSTGTLNAKVTQTPGHLVKGKGQKAKMECVPIKGHNYVFWYQQIPAKEFKFLISFQNDAVFDKTGMPTQRFLAMCPKNSPCSLEIERTELQDSAVYFCASSESTVLNISKS